MVHRAVCYSPSKRKIFDEAEQTQYGVSIHQAQKKADGTIFIHDNTNIKLEQLGVQPKFEVPTRTVAEIIKKVPVNTSINVTGHLKLDEITKVSVSGQEVNIRRGYFYDETGHIKITLWREYTSLKHDSSYIICDVKKGIYNSRAEIQTTNTTSFKEIKTITNYSPPEEDVAAAVTTTGKFFAVKYVHTAK